MENNTFICVVHCIEIMSTRRARIKAIAALPPRRKNADADAKNKQNVLKEGFEKGPPTPRTPRADSGKKDETKSPAPNTDVKSPVPKTVRTPPLLIPISSSKTPISVENVPSPRPATPKEPIAVNTTPQIGKDTPHSEKVSVITSTLSSDVIASPPPKNILENLPSPSAKVDGHERGEAGKKSSTDNDIQSTQEPNVENVQKKANMEDLGKDKDAAVTAVAPSGFDREKKNDIPDGKFLNVV